MPDINRSEGYGFSLSVMQSICFVMSLIIMMLNRQSVVSAQLLLGPFGNGVAPGPAQICFGPEFGEPVGVEYADQLLSGVEYPGTSVIASAFAKTGASSHGAISDVATCVEYLENSSVKNLRDCLLDAAELSKQYNMKLNYGNGNRMFIVKKIPHNECAKKASASSKSHASLGKEL